jgi:succinate dehydrogenase / fumarate reductase, membrane anchor subunit
MRRPGREIGSWLVQRASAVYMLIFMAFLMMHFIFNPPHSYFAWHAWMTSLDVSIVTGVFFAALLAHAWIGLRVVLTDYVHAIAFRVGLLILLGLGLAILEAWVIRILWMHHS